MYWSIFPWPGWSSALLLLDAEPKQADLPPWSPLSAGRKFSVVRRRRSHCVSPSISRSRQHVKTQCFGMDIQTLDQSMVSCKNNCTPADIQHGYFILSQRHLLWLNEQTWHWPWTVWSWDHIVCNCTYKYITKLDQSGCELDSLSCTLTISLNVLISGVLWCISAPAENTPLCTCAYKNYCMYLEKILW